MEEMKDRIRYIRREKKLTVREVCERLSVSRGVIESYEYGVRTPSASFLKLYATDMGANLEWLKTGEGEPFRAISQDERIAEFLADIVSEDESFKRAFISALATLDQAQWDALEAFINSLSSAPSVDDE